MAYANGNISVPIVKLTESGEFVALNFGVATRVADSDVPNWTNVVLFGKLGEVMSKKLMKGDLVNVKGSEKFSTYIDQDGESQIGEQLIGNDIRVMWTNKAARAEAPVEKTQSVRNSKGQFVKS